jgi:hypothetical protein
MDRRPRPNAAPPSPVPRCLQLSRCRQHVTLTAVVEEAACGVQPGRGRRPCRSACPVSDSASATAATQLPAGFCRQGRATACRAARYVRSNESSTRSIEARSATPQLRWESSRVATPDLLRQLRTGLLAITTCPGVSAGQSVPKSQQTASGTCGSVGGLSECIDDERGQHHLPSPPRCSRRPSRRWCAR